MNLHQQTTRKISILALLLICLLSLLPINRVQASSQEINFDSFDKPNNSFLQPSATVNSILKDVVRQLEPALTDFMTTFSFSRITSTIAGLERKYQTNNLSIQWDISQDAKLFVIVKVNGKQFCYTNIGAYSIKLKKSSRCR